MTFPHYYLLTSWSSSTELKLRNFTPLGKNLSSTSLFYVSCYKYFRHKFSSRVFTLHWDWEIQDLEFRDVRSFVSLFDIRIQLISHIFHFPSLEFFFLSLVFATVVRYSNNWSAEVELNDNIEDIIEHLLKFFLSFHSFFSAACYL